MDLKRKKRLIRAFIIFIAFCFYYFYIFSPQIHKVQLLKETLKVNTDKLEEKKHILSEGQTINEKYNKLDKKIQQLNNRFFLSIKQENIIVILNEIFEDSNVEFDSIQFIKGEKEKFKNQEIYCMKAIIPMKCTYNDLLLFLKKIRTYKKKIIIDQLQIDSIEENVLSVSISLNFYSLFTSVEDDSQPNQDIFKTVDSIEENPFITSSKTDEVSDSDSENTPIIEETHIPKKVLLDGFEKINTFFIGSNKNIQGTIIKSTQRNEGKYSLKFTYNFITPSRNSMGNLVYENKKIYISQQGQLGISVYSLQKNNHKIGIVIKDMNGRSYSILLTNKIDWTGWRHLTSNLPIEISYPAMVERIYVQSINFDPTIKGILLFDNLHVICE